MIPLLILFIFAEGTQPVIEQIQFRNIESCESAAKQLERELYEYKARAICINRSVGE